MRNRNLILLTFLIFAIFFTQHAYASKLVNVRTLRAATNDMLISSYPIASGATVTSDSIRQSNNEGFANIDMSISGSVTISVQVSPDGVNFEDPYTTDGSTLTSAAQIASAVTADRWIIYTAKMAPYIRYKFVAGSASTITARHIHQEDN